MPQVICRVDNISKSFAEQVLYTHATFQLNLHERWALVGPNGSGKTTLLKIILGQESADAGEVLFAKGVTIGYLEQELSISENKTALKELTDSCTEIKAIETRLREIEATIEASADPLSATELATYGALQERFQLLGGYELESRARAILSGLGFSVADFEKHTAEFSGGWRMRLALGKLLLKQPDLLLLDEPTNHLDLESVRWFKNFLSSYAGSVLLVSHDRSFMDGCVSHVAALENRLLMTYTGTYSQYLKQREDNLEQLKAKRAAQEKEIAHMQVFVNKFRYKPTKAKQAQERMRRIEKIKAELVVLPEQSRHVHFDFPRPPRTGDLVLDMVDISKSFGENHVYTKQCLSLYRGDRVALVGPNGAGKSTLLKLMAGVLVPDAGQIVYGKNVTFSYYAQHRTENLNPALTPLSELQEAAPKKTQTEIRRILGAFLFKPNDVDKPISVLSGGEKSRLSLAKMLLNPDPLLLLDEPTNHLDIDSVVVLEEALQSFEGTIVLISHDEHLISRISNKIVDIRDHRVSVYQGDFDYYLFKRDEIEKGRASEQELTVAPTVVMPHSTLGRNRKTKEQKRAEAEARNQRNRAHRHERERLAVVEGALKAAQAREAEITERLSDTSTYNDTSRFDELLREYEALSKKIPSLEAEWLELTELLEADEQKNSD